jgi:NADH-quinone oxidoreductase subunit L
MTAPLIILAALSLAGGAINLPQVHSLSDWLGHALGEIEALDFNAAVAVLSTALALLGFAFAYVVYGRQPARLADADPLSRLFPRIFTLFNRRWWIDEVYHAVIVRPFNRLSAFLAQSDAAAIDASDRAAGALTQFTASVLQKTQTGQLNWNAFGIVCGLIVVLLIVAAGG